MNQGFNFGLVSVFMSSREDHMSVCIVVANNIHHGSYRLPELELGLEVLSHLVPKSHERRSRSSGVGL